MIILTGTQVAVAEALANGAVLLRCRAAGEGGWRAGVGAPVRVRPATFRALERSGAIARVGGARSRDEWWGLSEAGRAAVAARGGGAK